MKSIKALQTLAQETFSKCFVFLHPDKQEKEYQKVETNNAKDGEKPDQNEEIADWSTQETIYQTQGSDRSTPSEKEKKKIVLIGNIDEDSGIKKDQVTLYKKLCLKGIID